MILKGDQGCVVKSSHSDVKQGHAEASPQVQKEMKYLFEFCFTFNPPKPPPSLPSCPLPDLLMLF